MLVPDRGSKGTKQQHEVKLQRHRVYGTAQPPGPGLAVAAKHQVGPSIGIGPATITTASVVVQGFDELEARGCLLRQSDPTRAWHQLVPCRSKVWCVSDCTHSSIRVRGVFSWCVCVELAGARRAHHGHPNLRGRLMAADGAPLLLALFNRAMSRLTPAERKLKIMSPEDAMAEVFDGAKLLVGGECNSELAGTASI